MSTVTLPNAVLYFPTIEFRDEGWLRRSLCIWDHVDRIVPPSVVPKDSPDVTALSAAGVIRPVSLTTGDMEAAARDFERFLRANPCKPAALDTDVKDFALLHKDKVAERLQGFFASMSVNHDDDWFGLPKTVCHGYMMHLAESTARRRGMSKVTDDFDSFALSPFYDSDGHIGDHGFSPEDRLGHAFLGLTTIVPKHISEMPLGDLLAFRERTVDGRRALAAAVLDCARDVAAIEDPKAAKNRLGEAATEFERWRQVIARESTYHARDLATSALCVGLPAFLTAVSTIAAARGGSVLDPLTLGGGTVFALAASMGAAFSHGRQSPIDPARAYYVSLQTEAARVFATTAHNRENAFWAVIEEFVND